MTLQHAITIGCRARSPLERIEACDYRGAGRSTGFASWSSSRPRRGSAAALENSAPRRAPAASNRRVGQIDVDPGDDVHPYDRRVTRGAVTERDALDESRPAGVIVGVGNHQGQITEMRVGLPP